MGWEKIKFKRMMIFSIYNDDDGDGDYGDIMRLLFRIRWCYDVARKIGVCQGCSISPRRGLERACAHFHHYRCAGNIALDAYVPHLSIIACDLSSGSYDTQQAGRA